ncbi:MAG TPA: hypothetical protein VMT94_05660 [Burkholderiales bacterium]|nr:hypothetical protein [Burkholderiales bacterium]
MSATTITVAFIVGLILMAIMGAVCGHYTLKMILLIEKSKADRARQQASDTAPLPAEEKPQA